MTAAAKPKAGRRGQGGGRPRAPAAKVHEALRLVKDEGLTPEEAAEHVGVGSMTVRRAIADPSRVGPVEPEATPSPAAPPSEVALMRRILKARNPGALAELDAGLAEAAKGEPALVVWLARPADRGEGADPMAAVLDALDTALAFVGRLSPQDRRAATILNAVSTLGKTAETIAARRPRVETADEVTARITARRDDAVRKIVEYTGEARAKLDADRTALEAWASQNLGPLIAAELARRLGAMLAGTPS
jgi:hypothetical protein